ncbi:MAG: hypothetical protein JW881_00705 [Spirochaetales bacterium]|nr:hypothetical protein [Spirochaetales bacterium]
MYIRYVVGYDDEKLHHLNGVFSSARILKDKGKLYPYEEAFVEELFEWFNRKLPCPPFSSTNWPDNAVSWFKDTALEYISKLREIIALIEEKGVSVRTIKTSDPGKIVYEDDFQIVAVNRKY